MHHGGMECRELWIICIVIDLINCNNSPFDIQDINLVPPTLEKDFLVVSLAVEQALIRLIYIAQKPKIGGSFDLSRLILPRSI